MMKIPKSLMLFLSTSFIGLILASFLAPKALTWYFTSPVTVVDCSPVVAWSVKNLLLCQTWGAVIGLLVGLGIYLKINKRQKDITL